MGFTYLSHGVGRAAEGEACGLWAVGRVGRDDLGGVDLAPASAVGCTPAADDTSGGSADEKSRRELHFRRFGGC